MKNKRILISGASIAGPALAFWLRRYGFDPTIVERAPAIRPGGYAVDFRGASVRVLERMGLLPDVQRMQTRIGAITIVDQNNKKLASMPDGFTSGELEILRGDLAGIFHEATREDTEYIFDDSIASMQETDSEVNVLFERGGQRSFDLVVGAAGGCLRRCGPSHSAKRPISCIISAITFRSLPFLTTSNSIAADCTTAHSARRLASSTVVI